MLKKLFHPFILYIRLSNPFMKHKLIITRKAPIPNGVPIIFVANHSCVHDAPVILASVRKHTYILSEESFKQTFAGFQLSLNGAIWVKRGDRKSGERAKYEAVKLLKRKTSLLVFAEGTWNTTDNILMLPFHKGVIDIAKESNATIVPIVTDYSDKSCRVDIGEPFFVNEGASSVDEAARLRDTMATIKWEIIENSIANRIETSKAHHEEYVRFLHSELSVWDTEKETAAILKLHDTAEEAFAHLRHIEINKDNAFLLRPNRNEVSSI